MEERPRYRLVFEVLPAQEEAAIRLRALLKFALRCLRMRCLEAVELPPERDEAQEG